MSVAGSRIARVVGSSLLCVAVASAAGAQDVELARDGGFDDPGLSDWTLEVYDTSTLEWSAADATGDGGSGSLHLVKKLGENPNSLRVSQCLAIGGSGMVQLGGRARVPVPSFEHQPYLVVSFSDQPGCQGNIGSFFPSIAALPADTWTAVGPFEGAIPEGTRSARLYAGVIAAISLGSPDVFEASWDDVSLVPEPGAGGVGLAVTGALAVLAAGRRRAARC